MGLRDHVAVLVVRDGQQPVHALELVAGQPDPGGERLVDLADHLALAHVGAHGGQPVQDAAHDLGVARREQVGQVLERDPQVIDRAEDVVGVGLVAVGLERRDHGRERRHVPDHRQRAELRVQRQRHAPADREVVDRRAPRRLDPVAGDAVTRGGLLHLRVLGVQEHGTLRAEQGLLVGHRGGLLDAIGVVEHQPEVADAADARLRADRRLADLDPRVAERALLGLAGAVVEVDLLVRAAGHAVAPAAAAVLVDEDDAVLLALVHRAGRAARDARGVQAVLADPRQEEHERLLVGHPDLLLDARHVRVADRELRAARQALVPVRPPA